MTKVLGDAGEHYALSQFSFAGKSAAKMPDNWKAYDLVVESGNGLVRVSVKVRSETSGWRKSKWFIFDEDKQCDWIALIFKSAQGQLRSWVIPFDVALLQAAKPSKGTKYPHQRDLKWHQLQEPPLVTYENNWTLKR